MKPLFTELQYNFAKQKDKLFLTCYYCNGKFQKEKYRITRYLSLQRRNLPIKNKIKYCSKKCRYSDISIIPNHKLSKLVTCLNCSKLFLKEPSDIRVSPNNFCCKHCSGVYNASHKKTGYNRSKLELYIEQQLLKLFPSITFKFNDRTIIGYELDIYLPEINLAFELNGILHYKPIYGIKKLQNSNRIDALKLTNCNNHNIELYVIDTSTHRHFNKLDGNVFLNIISNIINTKLSIVDRIRNDLSLVT